MIVEVHFANNNMKSSKLLENTVYEPVPKNDLSMNGSSITDMESFDEDIIVRI